MYKRQLYEASRKNNIYDLKKVGDYNIAAQVFKSELLRRDFQVYYRIGTAVIDSHGRVLGASGEREILDSTKCFKYSEISKGLEEGNYLVKIGGKIYAKVIIPYPSDVGEKKYFLAAVPLDLNFIQYLKNFIELGNNDKIFAVIDKDYVNGDFNLESNKDFISLESYNILKKENYKYFYKKQKIDDEPYYIAILSLKDYKNQYIGNFGVAISRAGVFKTKIIISIFITMIVLALIGMCSTVFTRVLSRLLSPLRDITEAAERISLGDYETPIKFEGSGEIKTLAVSIKKMLGKLEENQKKLKVKNKKLKENLNKITTVEQLLLGIQIEDDVMEAVKRIMSAFTSEMGLGFSRCMFFRYSRERDVMMGELTQINSHIAEIKNNDILRERKSGFDFQIKELKDVVPLIKIPFQKIIYPAEL